MTEAERLAAALLQSSENTAAVLAALVQQQSQQGGAPRNKFAEASKVIRLPDPFEPKSAEEEHSLWPDFLLNFKSWLYYADNVYETDLDDVESHLDTAVDLLTLPMDKEIRAKQLYSILTGLLKGRALRILRQTDDRNGFEVYRQLCRLYAPNTKSRTMALLSAIMSLPPFVKDKTLLEQIQGLERLREEYRKAGGQALPDDVLLSTLLRVLPTHIRQQMQLRMTETTTYSEVRALVLSYESVTTSWTSHKIHSEFGIGVSASQPYGGPSPMEIDMIGKNGKGKGKRGKTKSKDGKGKGGSFKGKGGKDGFTGKGKGHQDTHGKGKGGGQSQKADGNCLYCGKYGHWKRDCRAFQRDKQNGTVRQVENQPAASVTASGSLNVASVTPAPSTTYSLPPSSSPQTGNVRLLHRVDVDDGYVDLTMLDGWNRSFDGGSINMVSSQDDLHDPDVSRVCHFGIDEPNVSDLQKYHGCCCAFDMTATDADDSWTFPPNSQKVFDLTDSCDFRFCTPDLSHAEAGDKCLHVFAVHAEGHAAEIIMDSGADGSVLPISFGHFGKSSNDSMGDYQFVDAQGKALGVQDVRVAEIQFGTVKLRERFIVAPVTSPLISLGRLCKLGWSLQNDDAGMRLTNGDQTIPLRYRKNSLCADGVIRMVGLEPTSASSFHVRAVELGFGLRKLKPNWTKISDGLYGLSSYSTSFIDVTLAPAESLLWHRTTLVQRKSRWEVVEYNQEISKLASFTDVIPNAADVERVITLGHTVPLSASDMGFTFLTADRAGNPGGASSGHRDVPGADVQSVSPPVAGEPADGIPIAADDPEAAVDVVIPASVDEVEVQGVKINSASTVQTLRTACGVLGVATWGNRSQLFARLMKHIQQQGLLAEYATHQHVSGDVTRNANPQPQPEVPSEQEVADHMLTHYPYRAWCEQCLQHKARQDVHRSEDHVSSANSVISFDFGFCQRHADGSDKLTVLVCHDRQTKLVHAIPTMSKGGKYLQYLTTELTRFIVYTGHLSVTLRCDNEPSTVAILQSTRKACRALGIKTGVELVAVENHPANGAVEQSLQVLRDQAGVLVTQLEHHGGARDGQIIFGANHPVYAWALIHSAFLHNRFCVNYGQTAYERATDRQYTGRICCFGEVVYGFLKSSAKAAPQWCKGVWLTKTLQNDVHIVAVPAGQSSGLFVTRSIRRTTQRWSLEFAGRIESMPSDFGYAALGSQLVLSKRILPPQPVPVQLQFDMPAISAGDEAGSDPPSPRDVLPGPADESVAPVDASSAVQGEHALGQAGQDVQAG